MREATELSLREAMARLINGDAGATDGSLTWNNVVKLSEVSRSTAFRGTENIRREWEQLCAEKRIFSPQVIVPPAAAAELRRGGGRAEVSKKELRRMIGIMADHIQALSIHLEDQIRKLDVAKAESAALAERLGQSPSRISDAAG